MNNKDIKNEKQSDTIHEPKNNPADPRKNPRPGYDEKNPTKKDIQGHPENQHSGKNSSA